MDDKKQDLPAIPDTKEEEDDSLVTLRKLVEAVRRYHNNGYWPGVMDLLRHSEKAIEVLLLEKKETGGRTIWECGCGTTNGVNLAACGVCNRPRSEGEVYIGKETGGREKALEEPGAVAANTVNGQMALRLSINPTYDSRKTGPRFEVETRCNGRLSSCRPIQDPFIRTTVMVGWRDMLSALFRLTRAEVEVRVSGDTQITEDVMELDANYIGHGSTRRAEWNTSIETALAEFGGSPSDSLDNENHPVAPGIPKSVSLSSPKDTGESKEYGGQS